MGAMASQITSLTTVYSIVYLSADQRKHQSSALLAFVMGIHRRPVNTPHKWRVKRKMFPFDDVNMKAWGFIWCLYTHIVQDCLTGTRTTVWFPQYHSRYTEVCGKSDWCLYDHKHDKAQTVCIFSRVYMYFLWYIFQDRLSIDFHRTDFTRNMVTLLGIVENMFPLNKTLFIRTLQSQVFTCTVAELILGLLPANGRRRSFVTTSLIGWAQA